MVHFIEPSSLILAINKTAMGKLDIVLSLPQLCNVRKDIYDLNLFLNNLCFSIKNLTCWHYFTFGFYCAVLIKTIITMLAR